MGAVKTFYHDITDFIESNRSLAEASPLNLVGRGCKPLDDFYASVDFESFEIFVNQTLDSNE